MRSCHSDGVSHSRAVVRGTWERSKAFVQQDDYGQDLEHQIVTRVGEAANAFEKAVKICLNTEVHDMGQNVVRLGKGQDEMIDGMRDVKRIAAGSWERVEAILLERWKQLEPSESSMCSISQKSWPPWCLLLIFLSSG